MSDQKVIFPVRVEGKTLHIQDGDVLVIGFLEGAPHQKTINRLEISEALFDLIQKDFYIHIHHWIGEPLILMLNAVNVDVAGFGTWCGILSVVDGIIPYLSLIENDVALQTLPISFSTKQQITEPSITTHTVETPLTETQNADPLLKCNENGLIQLYYIDDLLGRVVVGSISAFASDDVYQGFLKDCEKQYARLTK